MNVLATVISAVLLASPSPAPQHFDVLVSAGHEGRPASCARFPQRKCNLGAAGERQWTPIVADAVTRALRVRGYSVAREPADFDGLFDVKAAVFIHFDGNDHPCTTGASIGYHTAASLPAAQRWRALYSHYFPFEFEPDNFTDNLKDYYGFRQVNADDGDLVIELGEISCPAQKAWLAPRLDWAGDLIAHFIADLIVNPPKHTTSNAQINTLQKTTTRNHIYAWPGKSGWLMYSWAAGRSVTPMRAPRKNQPRTKCVASNS